MLLLRKPATGDVTRFIERQRTTSFTYTPVGGTRTGPLPGYAVDRNRMNVGAGERAFDRAVAAVRRWEMFNIPWVTLCWPDAPIAVGTTVAIVVPVFGVWTMSACRIVYVIDEPAPVRRFGFAYGTVEDHIESGEERFSVEWRDDDSVWYDIFACSRPRHPLARIGNPIARRYQRRFASDSMKAMAAAV